MELTREKALEYVAKYGTAPYREESREDRYTDEEIVIDM